MVGVAVPFESSTFSSYDMIGTLKPTAEKMMMPRKSIPPMR